MKRLIVTADDLGLHKGMNYGAVRTHRHGIVTACSVVANGREFDHAVDLLRDHARLDVGVHLTFVEEIPLLPLPDVASLANRTGRFHQNYRAFLRRYLAGAIRLVQLERELRTQVEKCLRAGLVVRHLNGHQHLHQLPGIFPLVLRIAHDYSIPYVRIADDRGGSAVVSRQLAIGGMNLAARLARHRARGLVISNRYSIGVAEAGRLEEPALLRLFASVVDLTELVCHPGSDEREIRQAYDWGYSWERETDALCSSTVRSRLDELDIELVGVRDVVDSAGLVRQSAQPFSKGPVE